MKLIIDQKIIRQKFKWLLGALLTTVIFFTSNVAVSSDRNYRLYPYIFAKDAEVSDFAFSIATVVSNILGKEIGGSDRWNVAFFSGKNLLIGDRINVTELGIKDEKLKKALGDVRSAGQKCVVQEYSHGERGSLIVGIASYNYINRDSSKICFVVALSHFYKVKNFSPSGELSEVLVQFLEAMNSHVRH